MQTVFHILPTVARLQQAGTLGESLKSELCMLENEVIEISIVIHSIRCSGQKIINVKRQYKSTERCASMWKMWIFCQYFWSLKLLYLSIVALGIGPSDFKCMCISSHFPSNQMQCQSGAAPGVTVELRRCRWFNDLQRDALYKFSLFPKDFQSSVYN